MIKLRNAADKVAHAATDMQCDAQASGNPVIRQIALANLASTGDGQFSHPGNVMESRVLGAALLCPVG